MVARWDSFLTGVRIVTALASGWWVLSTHISARVIRLVRAR